MPENKKEQVLSVRDLDITFKTTAGKVHAIRRVNIDLYKGETVALVGESGSGKSVTMKAAMGILAQNAIVNSGSIQFSYHHADGSPETVDLLQKDKKWIRRHINGPISCPAVCGSAWSSPSRWPATPTCLSVMSPPPLWT